MSYLGSKSAAAGAAGTTRYPAEHECDVVLSDGSVAAVRPIRPGDAAALIAFHSRLSPETVYRRFMGPHPHLSAADADYFTSVDYRDRMALVAYQHEELVAVGRYDRLPETERAEVAFVVADGRQHLGLGTLLLEHLAASARRRGIATLSADTLASNHPMLEVFERCGLPTQVSWHFGEAEVLMPLTVTDEYTRAVLDRHFHATYLSLQPLAAGGGPAVCSDPRAARDGGHRTLDRSARINRSGSAIGLRSGLVVANRAAAEAPAGTTISTYETGDVDACDAIAYLAMAEGVDSIRVYVDRPRRPRTFVASAWAAGLRKPIEVSCFDPDVVAMLAAAEVPLLGPRHRARRARGAASPRATTTHWPDGTLADDPTAPRLGNINSSDGGGR